MRINDTQQPPSDPSVNSDNGDSQQKADANDNSSFSRMLAKKREASQDGNQPQGGGKSRQAGPDASSADLVQPEGKPFDTSLQTAQIEGKHVVPIPQEVQQVVREISVAVNSRGNQQVHIELNSNALKGLSIRIERQDGGVAIQFQSTSEQVSSLLLQNLPSLSQGLADRGVAVSNINVSGPRDSARAQEGGSRPNFGNQSGRQSRGR